jgi:ABC-2 type transport system permease protein
MRAFWKLLVANLKEFARDRMALFWMLAFPIFFIFLFGTIFSGEGNTIFPIGLVVEDSGPAGARIAEAFEQVPVFEVERGDLEEELEALKKGDRRVVVVLPQGLSEAIAGQQPLDIPVYYDPSNQTTSQIILSLLRQVLEEVDRHISGAPHILRMSEQTILSHRLRNIDFFLPGVLAMALMQLGIFGTALPLISLRERQVLRRLSATPLPRFTLLAATVAQQLLTGVIQTALILVIGALIFHVQVVGSWPLLAGLVALGGAAFIALGFFVAAVSPTEESGHAISQLINFPMLFLSGTFFPMEAMPKWLRPVTAAMPLTYLGDAMRQVMVGASALHPMWLDAVVLGGWLVLCVALSVRFFRWE